MWLSIVILGGIFLATRPVYGEGEPRPEGVVGGGYRRFRVYSLIPSVHEFDTVKLADTLVSPSHHRFAAVPPPRKRGGWKKKPHQNP